MPGNERKYFYCGSTQALLYALANPEYTIISPTFSSKQLCDLFQRDLIYIQRGVALKNLLLKPRRIKGEIQKLINIVQHGELHFSHTQFAVFCFLLVNSARHNNIPVYFHNFEFVYNKASSIRFSVNNIAIYLKKIYLEAIYGIRLVFKELNNNLVISIDEGYISENNITLINEFDTYFDQILHLFLNAPEVGKTFDNLFLTQNLLHNELFEKQSILALYQYLKNKPIVVKLHPGMKEEEDAYFAELVIDYDIPSEFLYNSVKNSVLAVHSAALITASKFKHIKSISLIDLLVPLDKELFVKIKKDLMIKSAGNIIFPQTLEELNNLIHGN